MAVHVQGVAFMATRKGALGITLGCTHGFVLRKLGTYHAGSHTWSAPVFFTASQVG